tara:strand:+ start:13407 stop:14471 length:1065 start_codon:yes stop_codon:yes gene_type:complete
MVEKFGSKENNKFDKNLNFRFAKVSDINKIQNFYKAHWPYKNIITEDLIFLLYEFADGLDLNFLICECKNTNSIESIIGFYSYSKHSKHKHICGSMSLVNPLSKYPLLGIETLKRLKLMTKCFSYCGTNTNPKTMMPLVKRFLSHHTDKMNHYYLINDRLDSFDICNPDKNFINKKKKRKITLKMDLINDMEDLIKTKIIFNEFQNIPFKSLEYIIKKYILHPIYKYNIYKINESKNTLGIIVTRIVTISNISVLRVIDFIGQLKVLPFIDINLLNMIYKNKYEYVDILTNLPEEFFEASLFIDKSKTKSIIPNYFEPFEKKNIEIYYESSLKDLYFFKGDADGDRPNFRRVKY